MNKNKYKSLSKLLGLSAFMVTALVFKEKYQDYQKTKMIAEIRQFFSEIGAISVLYINEAQSDASCVRGGIVMADDREFSFSYQKGDLTYQEETK
ncbi:DUF4651 domain-containing protein [Streptococcus didelphis]|uniref:DUF4651 domain-containing protein n=1 Tax=Streptococcus didelphis TaxID=102886 RepID=A0ABY9LIW1_9STRE|nr:DUF4651 domain-containing protein [Streptococcus didelphis]WMB28763.1 DUF4651 domain-containing protein [Streptococcus didelphis]WMB29428.1 DUF4651 domain-containing protein [Streptococcus didelphis]